MLPSQVLMVTLALLVSRSHSVSKDMCSTVCNVDQYHTGEGTQLLKYMCHCQEMWSKTTTDSSAEGTMKVKRDPNLCKYLCSIQMGGDACNCSNPSLPGK